MCVESVISYIIFYPCRTILKLEFWPYTEYSSEQFVSKPPETAAQNFLKTVVNLDTTGRCAVLCDSIIIQDL